MRVSAVAVALLVSSELGCGGRGPLLVLEESDAALESDAGEPDVKTRPTASQLDILLVVDDSLSMLEKQRAFAEAVPDLLARFANPLCVDVATGRGSLPPAPPPAACPSGQSREFAPLRDIHFGVITASLGSAGADTCSEGFRESAPYADGRARLIGTEPRGASIPTWAGSGFVAWDPDGEKTPGGESDFEAFAVAARDLVLAAGIQGCGFEAPLEAAYRFLVDPEPYAALAQVGCEHLSSAVCMQPTGIDDELLSQRRLFSRPGSAVLVIVLTDENDCSIVAGGQSFLVLQSLLDGEPFRMPRATSVCADDPNHECCISCAHISVPPGCPDPATDASCQQDGGFYLEGQDSLNLRCFDQKRRFGYDSLAPLERYARAFGSTTIPDAAGNDVQNPLFSSQRLREHVFVAVVAGVPSTLLGRKPSSDPPAYASVEELEELGAFARILGDPARGIVPSDPHMIESIDPRPGLPGADAAPDADPIHGHELWPTNRRNELQYACIFPMAEPWPCGVATDGCECGQASLAMQKPLCQAPGDPPGSVSTTQYRTQAYPGPRLIALARQLGKQGIITSACAGPRDDPTSAAYGYRPAVAAIVERLRVAFDTELPTLEDLAGAR